MMSSVCLNMSRFDAAMNAMGLGGGGGLRRALPLVLRFLSLQPVAVIFNAVVNRQMSASPLQRSVPCLDLCVCHIHTFAHINAQRYMHTDICTYTHSHTHNTKHAPIFTHISLYI